MHTDKAVLKNTAYQIIGKAATASLSLVSFGFLVQYLKPFGMGQYNLVISYVSFVVIFADFGLNTILTREIAGKKATDEYISHTISLRFLLSIVVLFVGSVIVFLLPYPYIVKLGIIIFSIGNLFLMLSAMIWAIFQAHLRFDKIVIAQVVNAVSMAVLLILGSVFKLPFLFLISASSIGMLLGFIVSMFFLEENISFLKIQRDAFKAILKESWPLGAGVIASVAYFKIDSLILPIYYNPATHPDLGYYAVAYKLFEVTLIFGGFFTQTLFPVFSSVIHSEKLISLVKKYFFYSAALSVLSGVFLFFLSKPLVIMLGKYSYLPAIPSVQILSLATGISILAGFFLNLGVAGGRQLSLLKYALAALVLNIVLNIMFIPKFSFIAASWNTVITQTFILFGNAYVAYAVIKKTRTKKILS